MHYHPKAALTVAQRATIQRLHRDGATIAELARRFAVHRRTIQRWVCRSDHRDRSSAPQQHGRRVVTQDYRTAVLAHRAAHPAHGPLRIADDLRTSYPTANAATVWRILKAAGQSTRRPKKTDASTDPSGTPSSALGHPGTARD